MTPTAPMPPPLNAAALAIRFTRVSRVMSHSLQPPPLHAFPCAPEANRRGTPLRLPRSSTRSHRAGASTVLVRSGLGDLEPDEDALVTDHRRAVVVPVRVLAAGRPPVVVDERLHRVRQVHDRGRAVDLEPLTEEAIRKHAE